MDRNDQRQNKRELETLSCKEVVELPVSSLPDPRPAIACSGPSVLPAPDPFLDTTPCPPATPELARSPTALNIGNSPYTAYCPTGATLGLTGTISATVTASDQIQQVFFQTLTNIKASQLNYIYGIAPSASAYIISASLSGATSAVQTTTKLTEDQVEELMYSIQQSKFLVDTLAIEKARNGLVCRAYNAAQSASCTATAYFGATASVPASIAYNPTGYAATGTVVVDFSLLSSTGGQDAFAAINVPNLIAAQIAANAIAAAEAERQLRCVFSNDIQHATCCASGASCASGAVNNLGFQYTVPNDSLPVLSSGLPLRVGATATPADTIFSTVSKSDANIAAAAIALDNLNCYFPSEDVFAACTGTGATQVASTYPAVYTSDYITWSATADTINIPYPITGGISIDDVFLNTRIILTSETGGTAPAGTTCDTIYYVASATSGATGIDIQLGTTAASHADYQTSTQSYINLTDSFTGATSYIKATVLQDNAVGKYTYLLRGRIIQNDTASSTASATSEANVIVTSLLDCFWANAATGATCAPVSFTGVDGTWYTLDANAVSSPNYHSSVTAGTFISYVSQQDADTLAADQAAASLQCYYCNTRVDPVCTPYGGDYWSDSDLPLSATHFVPNCWSANATPGMPPDVICDFLAPVAQNTAISVSSSLLKEKISNEEDCCYASAPVYNTVFCETGAIRGTSGSLNSLDNFYLPSGIIIVCATGTVPGFEADRYTYTDLYASSNLFKGCCSNSPCATGTLYNIGTLFADTSSAFTSNPGTVTFYSTSGGTAPYIFPADARYVVQKLNNTYTYKTITLEGSTAAASAYGLLACPSNCSGLFAYNVRGISGSSTGHVSELRSIFCGGTALEYTLYSDNIAAFSTDSVTTTPWYTDSCGTTLFAPKSATANFVMGLQTSEGNVYSVFSITGGSTSSIATVSSATCAQAMYPYFLYPSATSCYFSGTGATLYTSTTAAFISSTGTELNFYSTQFNDVSTYSASGGVAYLNWLAPDGSSYYRGLSGVTASTGYACSTAFTQVTVYYSNTGATSVCSMPWATAAPFNDNVISLWSYNNSTPFSTSGGVEFYTEPSATAANLFKPGASASGTLVYLAPYTAGTDLSLKYRVYTHAVTSSVLSDFSAASHKASPFLQTSGSASGSIWEMGQYADPCLSYDGLRVVSGVATGCTSSALYSDVYDVFAATGYYSSTAYKKVIYDAFYNKPVFNDGVDVTIGNVTRLDSKTFSLSDKTKIGALFSGALVQTYPYDNISKHAYVDSVNYTMTQFSITGASAGIATFSGSTGAKIIGFAVSATAWGTTGFSCTGANCDKLKVGHSLYTSGSTSYKAAYITGVSGTTITFSNVADCDLGAVSKPATLYVYGKHFTQLWTNDNKAAPLTSLYGLNSPVFKNTTDIYLRSLNIVGVSGSTAASSIIKFSDYSYCATNPSSGAHSSYLPTTIITGPTYSTVTSSFYQTSTTYNCDGSILAVTSSTSTTGPIPATGGTCDTRNAKQIEADDVALNLVNSFVSCYYLNTRQVYAICEPGTTLVKEGVVEPGTFVSQISQEDADRIAYTLAVSLVVCMSESVSTTIIENTFEFKTTLYAQLKKVKICDADGNDLEVYTISSIDGAAGMPDIYQLYLAGYDGGEGFRDFALKKV